MRDYNVQQKLEHEDTVRRINEKYAADLEEYNIQFEAMRREKDSIIETITYEMEEQRSNYDNRINEMNIENKNLETKNAN